MPPEDVTPTRTIAEEQELLRALLDQRAIEIHFQPIVDFQSGEVAGFEALTRFDVDTFGFRHAGELYDAAARCGVTRDLEALARRRTFESMTDWPAGAMLFLNNSPEVFTDDTFFLTLSNELTAAGEPLPTRHVVLEVTERTSTPIFANLSAQMLYLREMGFQVALDDVGAGDSGLNRITSMRPNWLKLDRELIKDLDLDPFKQNLIRFFTRFAKLTSIRVIAEGIERESELGTLMELGLSHGQGFFLGKPRATPEEAPPGPRECIARIGASLRAQRYEDPHTIRVTSLLKPALTLDASATAREASAALCAHAGCEGAVVLDRRRCRGWMAGSVLSDAATLQPDRQIGSLPIIPGPILGVDVTLAEALEVAAGRPEEAMAAPLIVQRRDVIEGIVTVRRLLSAASSFQSMVAPHTAPISGLPTRVRADGWLAEQMRVRTPMNLGFVDLRDFDGYNLAYGADMGDAMLRRLVGLLRAEFQLMSNGDVFAAHLGADRFMIGARIDLRPQLAKLVHQFEATQGEFFTPQDWAAEAFAYTDAAGHRHTCDLTSVRAVYLEQPLMELNEPRDVYECARRLRQRPPEEEGPWTGLTLDARRDAAMNRKSA